MSPGLSVNFGFFYSFSLGVSTADLNWSITMMDQTKVTVLGVAFAGVISVAMSDTPFSPFDIFVGLILVSILHHFNSNFIFDF
ncbi:MAG: hypothetical protein GF353_06065 [Candidatus Lokiarchaeota archaeon]|nr:hypothetical protein [Candidatus Lokiarchaeota archaeon]